MIRTRRQKTRAQLPAWSLGLLLVATGIATLGLHPRDVEVGLDKLLVEGSQAVTMPDSQVVCLRPR